MNDFRYIPIMQKPYCCAIACFLSILYKRTGKLYEQEQLAVFFGVQIDTGNQSAFENTMRHFTSINFDEGVKTVNLTQKVEEFFKDNGINLHVKSYIHSKIDDLESFIVENLEKDNDIWCEYTYGDIHNSKSSHHIHDGIIESYDRKNRSIIMIDPEPSRKNRFILPLDELQLRISGRFGRETGFLVISS